MHNKGTNADDSYKTFDGKVAGWWWLSSSGSEQMIAATVDPEGFLCDDRVDDNRTAARPAFWLDLESIDLPATD